MKKIKLFFSYAHNDIDYLEEFKEHLKVLERLDLIEPWDDNELKAGEKWNDVIQDKIYASDIMVFLLSPSLLASDYVYEHEMGIAMDLYEMNKAQVVPIIVKECLWQYTLFKEFQMLPAGAKAVNGWERREEAWVETTKELKRVIDGIIADAEVQSSSSLSHVFNKFEIGPTILTSDIKTRDVKLNINDDASDETAHHLDPNKDLVSSFLSSYSKWSFNIPRIINWGAKQAGYGALKEITYSEVQNILDKLVSEGFVRKINSKKNPGKFLYQFKIS